MSPRREGTWDYYGPRPVDRMAKRTLRSAGFRVHVAGLVSLLGRRRAGLRTLSKDESDLLRDGAAQASFPMWRLPRLLPGFVIAGCKIAPYSRDAATIMAEAGSGRRFEITQRRSWLPVADELAAARLPFHRVPFARGNLYVVHGRHGGEPIDHAYWSSRQSVHFERGGLTLELREVRGQGPGLTTLIRFARWASAAPSSVADSNQEAIVPTREDEHAR